MCLGVKACCSQYCPRSQGGAACAGAGGTPANNSLKTTEKQVSGGLWLLGLGTGQSGFYIYEFLLIVSQHGILEKSL